MDCSERTSAGIGTHEMAPAPAPARVLVIDDDGIVAAMVEEMLVEFGYQPAGVARDLETALRLAATAEFDVALLDVNLGGRASWPIADALAARGRPFLFVSGYDAAVFADAYREAPRLEKPFRSADLREGLARALGTSSRPDG